MREEPSQRRLDTVHSVVARQMWLAQRREGCLEAPEQHVDVSRSMAVLIIARVLGSRVSEGSYWQYSLKWHRRRQQAQCVGILVVLYDRQLTNWHVI
jgi:hypothetical protein